MVDRLAIFAACPTRKLLPQRLYCTFLSLYRSHIPNNVESWHVFPDDESIGAFLQNEIYKPKEILSLEFIKIPKGSNPIESSLSASDVSNRKETYEEDSKRKIGDSIPVSIRT
jgi:hypothetical protein